MPSQISLRQRGPDKRALIPRRAVAKDRVIESPSTDQDSPAIADSPPGQESPIIDPHSSGDASPSVGSSPISRLPNEIKHMIIEEASPESVVSLALSSRGWHDLVIAFIDIKRPPSLLKPQTLYRMCVDDDTIIKLLSDASWEDLTTISVCRLTWTPDKKFSHVRLSPFHVAAAKGNKKMVAFFIDKHCYIGSWHYPCSVPEYVVRAGNLEMLDFLIEKGLPGARSGSLVSVAAAAGHDKIVDRLLELNPGLLAKWGGWNKETQTTPLMAAMSSTDTVWRKMVPHLLSKGAVFTKWDIEWACQHGFEDRLIAARVENFDYDRHTEDARGAIMQRFTSLCQTKGGQKPTIKFIDSICYPNAKCDPTQAAECLDAAAAFLGKEEAFPWRTYKKMLKATLNMVAHRCQPNNVDRMFERMPHILSMVYVLLERYPEKFEPDIFPSMILELIQNIVARDLSLDLDGCQTLLQNTPMKNNWNEKSWHENSFRYATKGFLFASSGRYISYFPNTGSTRL